LFRQRQRNCQTRGNRPAKFFFAVFFLQILPRANRPDGSKTLLLGFNKKIPLILWRKLSPDLFRVLCGRGVNPVFLDGGFNFRDHALALAGRGLDPANPLACVIYPLPAKRRFNAIRQFLLPR
jgi:hypothetical protein